MYQCLFTGKAQSLSNKSSNFNRPHSTGKTTAWQAFSGLPAFFHARTAFACLDRARPLRFRRLFTGLPKRTSFSTVSGQGCSRNARVRSISTRNPNSKPRLHIGTSIVPRNRATRKQQTAQSCGAHGAGTFSNWPICRRFGFNPGFAAVNASSLTPYLFAMAEGVSPA
jgi:hypothetical protein